jgi:ADP-ribosylglycohydrolase
LTLPNDYAERVYAGVLGKLIGVYLGRPFEGWSYEALTSRFGQIDYYVHEQMSVPLVVTDDDISGTFTFLRALEDYGNGKEITARQIGQTWLNYLIENRTVLWWGGMGNSTEHTAYLRLKHGIPAPESGSIATNGKVVAEQIGSQIFIDGWGMISPGDPEMAAEFARRAGSVSHDGEAIYGAQVVAALEAMAFVESDINRLIDTAVTLIPKDSVIYRLIADLREWHAAEPDWRKTREKIVASYGYDRYGGNCHMVPNHALIIHSLLHGEGDFQKSLMIVNTCGWDTDCNSGNVGCILGIRGGLETIESGPDFRGPVADRMYLPTADGGRCVTDAVAESLRVVNLGRALQGEEPLNPKNGARFHFEMPGSVQRFMPDTTPESRGTLTIENVAGHSATGSRSLALKFQGVSQGRPARTATALFPPPEAMAMKGYGLLASPSFYPGQSIEASVSTDAANAHPVTVSLFLDVYNTQGKLDRVYGPKAVMSASDTHLFQWTAPDTKGQPICEIGFEISSETRADGTLYIDYIDLSGTPTVTFYNAGGEMARRAWVSGVDHFEAWDGGKELRIIQDEGTGLVMQGTREWTNYVVTADCTPHMVESAGVAARVQGMRRYYALLLCHDGYARLVKALDGITVLAEAPLDWQFGERHELEIIVSGNRIEASVDRAALFDVIDENAPLTGGGIALICTEGRTATERVTVRPL